MGHWLAEGRFAVFVPALAPLIFNSLYRRATVKAPLPAAGRCKPQVRIASVVKPHCKKTTNEQKNE